MPPAAFLFFTVSCTVGVGQMPISTTSRPFAVSVPVSRLLTDQIKDLTIDNVVYGHLGYPVLQAADILLYKGNVVPVGEDRSKSGYWVKPAVFVPFGVITN